MTGQTTGRLARLGCLLGLVTLLAGGPAAAQTDTERAGARAAASEGLKAFKAGDYSKAVDLFTRAESLVHAPPHLLYIARGQEKLGKLVKAREAYMKITREKLDANAPDAFKDAVEKAKAELAALEPRVPALTINVSGEGAGDAVVTMDGNPVPKALVGVPYPVDPGEHQLQATGKGVQSAVATVNLSEGAKESVALELVSAPGVMPPGAAPDDAPGGNTPAPGGGSDTSGASTSGSATMDTGGMSGMRIGGYVGLGVGVVGIAAGTFFALQASSKRDEADSLCTPAGCPANKRAEIDDLDSSADSASTNSVIGFVVGGVGLATGVTLLLLDSGKDKGQAGVRPYVGVGSAGVVGRF